MIKMVSAKSKLFTWWRTHYVDWIGDWLHQCYRMCFMTKKFTSLGRLRAIRAAWRCSGLQEDSGFEPVSWWGLSVQSFPVGFFRVLRFPLTGKRYAEIRSTGYSKSSPGVEWESFIVILLLFCFPCNRLPSFSGCTPHQLWLARGWMKIYWYQKSTSSTKAVQQTMTAVILPHSDVS